MGQEIASSRFTDQDFAQFTERLRQETALLGTWFADPEYFENKRVGGFELEAWLVDQHYVPAPINQTFLAQVNNPLVVPELAQFNVELNSTPLPLIGKALTQMGEELQATWQACTQAAEILEAHLMMVGILPTVRQAELTLANMSPLLRYRALNEQVQRLRQAQPLQLDIQGQEHLNTLHHNLMVESATTSFQIHLQLDPRQAVRFFNAAQILSGPMVAITANAPYLFGKDLWAETRIPLFEQAVAGVDPRANRVTFGSAYAQGSLYECFTENLAQYPLLLPTLFASPVAELRHLRLHNGTIWRWNRPLIGFDATGKPHLRLEHRVVPAGPTMVDSLANAAFFFGLVQALATNPVPPEQGLAFAQAKANFYGCARCGLEAKVGWLGGKTIAVSELLLQELLPLAQQGLQQMDLDPTDIDYFLTIIADRTRSGQNGATWQRRFVQKRGGNTADYGLLQELTAAYLLRQQQGEPVHQWDF